MASDQTQEPGKKRPQLIEPDLLSACIHCGLCLPACPTYLASGRETESPRGRIYLLNEWNQGRLKLTPRLVEHIDSCLGCLGCQTACPSGVNYEEILNQVRPTLAKTKPVWYRFFMRFAFMQVLPNYFVLRILGSVLRFWQSLAGYHAFDNLADLNASGASAPHLIPVKRSLFAKLAQWQRFLPAVPAFSALPKCSWRPGKKTGKVQFFSGCVMDVFYNQVNHACVRLLVAQSRVVERPAQTCCGALAFHAGESDITERLAKSNIEYFAQTEGPIVVSAAGCGAMLRHYGQLLGDDPIWGERAREFSERVLDITESLVDGHFGGLPAERPANPPHSIAYHAACHLAHAQKVRTAPLQLLNGLLADISRVNSGEEPPAAYLPDLVALTEAEHCCGSAGIYNLLHPDMALAVLDRKMENIGKAGADLVVTTNPGCLLQLQAGATKLGSKVQVKHLCELLDDYYCEKS